MADIMSREKRSALMSRIRGRGTKIERLVERELRRRGIYFSTHASELPGSPDIVFRNGRLAVFLDGDFWHGWRFPKWEHKLQPYWRDKIAANRKRDQKNFRRLRRSGWTVLRIWEHQLKTDLDRQVERIVTRLAETRRRE